MFNEQEYANANPDLPGSWTDEEFQYHFNAFGFAEGRDVYWSATDYISLNTDLAGMTDEEAFSHWVTFGKDEGRVPWFQADEYITANGDLVGMTDAEALSHWIEYGMDEGRLQGFDSAGYLELNNDVPQGWTFEEALNHYYQYGMTEGRSFDAYVDEAPPEGTIVPVVDGNVTTLPLDTDGGTVTLTADDITVDGGVGTQTLRLTGDASARIDLTNPADQFEGLDLNGNGLIASDGIENNLSNAGIMTVSNFEVVDAYARNPIDETDHDANYFGDIGFDGTGFAGDGVSTDGNIYLGGLGVDTAFGGIGNDFMAGGGVAASRYTLTGAVDAFGRPIFMDNLTGIETIAPLGDTLYGGRNADFFFLELSALDPTDGNGTRIDGGSTWDDNASQDSDWVLLEASDDDEPVIVNLNDTALNGLLEITARSGVGADVHEIENLDASGNLYGFLNDFDVTLGGRSDAHTVGEENYGIGSTAQLIVNGSASDNIIIAGYDNDTVNAGDGSDILLGGNLAYLVENTSNPNLLVDASGLGLNVNAVGVITDGTDTLNGDNNDDSIVFEMDGGVVNGGADDSLIVADGGDTLWLTDFSMGRVQGATSDDSAPQADAMATMTTDATVRLDLGAVNGYQGYGGADELGTIDQTNYVDALTVVVDGVEVDTARADISNMENVNATGLGKIDYEADGGNLSEVNFNNQQNFYGIDVDLDLRGTDNAALIRVDTEDPTIDNETDLIREGEALYANTGNDVIEGRRGDDRLMGGEGNDDFYFDLNTGDNVDVIHRLTDADGDNIWDGGYSQDFGLAGLEITSDSSLTLSFTNNDDPASELQDFPVTGAVFTLDGVQYTVESTDMADAVTYSAFTEALNAALDADADLANLNATLNADNSITITDPDGAVFEAVGYIWIDNIAPAAGNLEWDMAVGGPTVEQSQDRLIFKAYEDRVDNEGVDDDAVTGSTISLGDNAYAEDLVVNFAEDGTRIAEGQQYRIDFTNLAVQDIVTVNVNGVLFTGQVGVAPNETLIPGGETTQDFINRFAGEINTFLDDDTAAGQVTAVDGGTVDGTANSRVLLIGQAAYNGEETVFMAEPQVTVQNLSGGEGVIVDVTNISQSEIHLLDFDGQNNNLSDENVKFWGEEEINRSVLATAAAEGGTLTGMDADVINVEGNIQGLTQNLATGFNDNFAVHGDDLLVGADGDDTISGLTGDDRVLGSRGGDTLDGGKDWYLVTMVDETEGTLMALNDYDAAQQDAESDVLSVEKILQNENGAALVDGFDDTLLFQQADFGSVGAGGAGFTITMDDYEVSGDDILLVNGGAGTVTVEEDGVVTGTTVFTNFENVRTVSGDGTLAGQGNDTLDVSALSTDSGGIRYNLTDDNFGAAPNAGDAGQVQYDANTEGFDPDDADGDGDTAERDWTDFFKADGVENVISGLGEDVLLIDETEADKHNRFEASLDDDVIEYYSDLADDEEPTVTITVEAESNTDTVMMTAGRLGLNEAVDTLESVETIDLVEIADSDRLDDVLDVTNVVDAVIDFVNQEVRANGDLVNDDDDAVVTILDMAELEIVNADYSDTVIVSDDMVFGNSQASPINVDLQFDSFLNYDLLDDRTAEEPQRMSLADLRSVAPDGDPDTADEGNIPEAVNIGLFTFNMGDDNDTVDYSNETGLIAAVVNFADATQAEVNNVLVSDNGNGNFGDGLGNRVDALTDTENIVASQGGSIIDLTNATTGLKVRFNADDGATESVAALDRDVYRVQLSELDTTSPVAGINFLEYFDASDIDPADQADQVTAAWNTIEGGDNNVMVEMTDHETTEDHRMILRGGDNEVNYNELTRSIELTINVNDQIPDNDTDNIINAIVTFTDGNFAPIGGRDIITTHSSTNNVSAGALRLEASQDAEDAVTFDAGLEKLFILGEVIDGSDQITVQTETAAGNADTIELTGFEWLRDATSDDVYDMEDLDRVSNNLTLVDHFIDDEDTLKVYNDAIDFGIAGVDEISMEVLNNEFTFDFDILDITGVTDGGLTITGDTVVARDIADDGGDPETLIFGNHTLIDDVTAFDVFAMTNATTGSSFDFDLDADELQDATNATLFTFDASADTLDASRIDDRDLTLTVTDDVVVPAGATVIGGAGDDTITGGAGDDTLQGGAGDDTLDGSFIPVQPETHSFTITGTISTTANNDWGITFSDDFGNLVVLDEADDTTGAGTTGGTIATGASYGQIGNAIESLDFSALDFDNDGTGDIASVSFDDGTGVLTFTMRDALAGTLDVGTTSTGVADFNLDYTTAGDTAAAAAGTVLINAVPDTGMPGVDANEIAGVVQTESADTFVFEETADLNGVDTINNFTNPATLVNDVLDFTAFLGGAAGFNPGPFTMADVGNVNVNGDVSIWDADGTPLSASTLAAEFDPDVATAFSANPDDVAVILEIDGTETGEDANLWYVYAEDANDDLFITEDEVQVQLVGVLSDAGDFTFAGANFA